MKKLALGALVVGLMMAACGGGGKVKLVDAGGDDDDDGPPATCNPITQTGCNANEACTWFIDQDTPTEVGHIGCKVLNGSEVALGGTCAFGPAGPQGFDNCEKGTLCISQECKTICDPQMAGTASGCDAQHSCSRYSGIFEVAGTITAGVCDPGADPLTQRLLVGAGNVEACGSPMPNMPTKGAYTFNFETFSCAPAGDATKTDRQPPSTAPNGQAFVNGCAAGFVPFFFADDSGAMMTLCSGLCASGQISNVTAGTNEKANKLGRASVLAKLVAQPAPRAGDGVCNAAAKGSGVAGSEYCIMLWTFLADQDATTGALTPGPSQYNYNLGVCFAFKNFHYDKDNDPNTGTNGNEAEFEDPSTLAKTSPDPTNMPFLGADFWGTQCPDAGQPMTDCLAATTAFAPSHPTQSPKTPSHVKANPWMRNLRVGNLETKSPVLQHKLR